MLYSPANAKLKNLAKVKSLQHYLENKRKVYSLDLLSGWSCPFAKNCLSKVKIVDGRKKIKDGKHTEFRCFSASQEATYPAVYNSRKNNLDFLKALYISEGIKGVALYLHQKQPADLGICRIHVAGDFFNMAYFMAWCEVARLNPDRLYYAYTKSIAYWVANLDIIPLNLILTASYGGRNDHLIEQYNLRSSKVVYSEEEANVKGLNIDHDDSHAADPTLRSEDFALLIHGIQPKGSIASEAIKTLKKNKVQFSYGRNS